MDREKKLVLTFDDGPDKRYTGQLLDILKENEVKAAFFVVAKRALEAPALIQRMLDEGHTVGLHSYSHKSALLMGPLQTSKDFGRSLEVMRSCNWKIDFYRPPWGHRNLFTRHYAEKYGLKLILWDVMAEDWQEKSTTESIKEKLLSRVFDGAVICLHDAGEHSGGAKGAPARTLAALRETLPLLKEKGYRFADPACEFEQTAEGAGVMPRPSMEMGGQAV